MLTLRLSIATAPLFLGLALAPAFAHSYGPLPRLTAAPGDNPVSCTQCHGGGTPLNGGAGSVKITTLSGAFYIPGVKQRISVTVSDPAQQRWGFELSARLGSDLQNGQAGQLAPVDNFTQIVCEDYGPLPCTSGVQFIEHTSAGTQLGTKNGATFQFDWTPPATNAGPITLYAAGNAANGDGTSGGDHIYTTSLQLTPLTPAAPTITGVLNGTTLAVGPAAPNSFISIFGTNLAVTTRAWQNSDFVDGAYPTSLDGVSVVLTANGAPRRGYVAYVSPTQVNVLLPSDTSPTTVQVQLKNSAGISTQTPVTVQANAPQLLTLDGKYVFATHADGSIVAKAGFSTAYTSTPAAPGETINVFATGCGATSPTLVSGQLPVLANPLPSLPQFTVAGAAATVSAGTVIPGVGGVYQIQVQVPASAANGDQQIAAQLGTNSSAPVLITVQH